MYANRWVATSTRRNGPSVDINSPEMVERKVKALLNKLTMGRFDTVSDQIIAWANQSEREKDGRTLIQVIKLIFETATDEEMFSKTHARLCRKMMEQISPKVQDSGVKNAVGKPYAGGQLFLKYLFNRCQEGFERGWWVAKEATTIIATSKLTEDQAAKVLREKTKGGDGSGLCSDEYYAAAKAKRRGLGLIRFIGELFKLQMLTERIIHGCIKKLLGNVETPGEEEIESLCMLLTIAGSLIDTQKAQAHLDMYFSRMKELMRNKNVNARMMFMLQDVIELRERRWVPRNAIGVHRTIAQIHETAVKETKLAQGKDIYIRQNASMSRGGSYFDGNCDAAEPPHPDDGRPVASSSAPTCQPKAGELSQFGKISKVQHQSPPPRHPKSPAPSSAGLPMSPRNPPSPQQQVPGTPTQPHAIPPILHPPHLSALQPPPPVTSPSAPATANLSTLQNANANVFVPAKVSVKNRSGQEVPFDIVKPVPLAAIPPVPPSPATVQKAIKRPIWMESEEQRGKRLAEERAARHQIEEQVGLKEEERKEKEEADHAEKERKDAEECAALGERQHREAEEKAEKEHAEQERFRKLQEEEEAHVKEKAEPQRKDKEEIHTTTEASENANTFPDSSDPVSILPERGEIGEVVSQLTTAAIEEPASADKSLAASRPSSSPAQHIPAELPIKPSEKEQLCIETTLPPSPNHPRKRPSPQTTTNANIALPLPSALATARHIEDINRITYPLGIKRPKPEINLNTQKGKFRYDREFLLQFINICKKKPDSLPPLDDIGLKPRDTSHIISRGGLCRNRSSNSPSMPSNTQSSSIGLGFLPGSMGKTPGSGFQMNQFSTSASKMSSEERFLAATAGRSVSVTDDPLDSRPSAMVRTIHQSGTGRKRTRTKRRANDSNRASVANNAGPVASSSTISPPIEPVVPLQMSANRWVATSTRSNGPGVDSDSPEVVERKVKALLNKLTIERFDSISDQIIAWANKSEGEKDGRTLIQVIKLVFDTAVDEEMFSEMYVRLCRKMMNKTSPKVQDDGIKNAEGKPFAGGQLFRKYLLSRCQEDFERGWAAKEKTAAASTSKVIEDQAVNEANEQSIGGDEYELYLDEDYAVAKAKRRGLGVMRFIGELFKAQMLTERIVHECVKMLLGNAKYPKDESETERLCTLLTTAGKLLDTQKARAHLDVYFSRMRELTKNKNFNARIMFILQDVFELRERRWVPRKAVAAPMTIAQVHKAATKTTEQSKLKQEKDSCMQQNASMSHGVSRCGGSRDAAKPSLPGGWPSTLVVSQSGSKAEAAGKTGSHIPAITPEEKIKSKIKEDADEFFSIRRLDEAESYFSSLPSEHRHWLVGALVTKSIEMKEQDVILVSDLFVLVREKELCNPTVFEKGFSGVAEGLDDLSVDIPKAWSYFATLLRGSGLDQDEKRLKRMAEKTMDPDKLNRLL